MKISKLALKIEILFEEILQSDVLLYAGTQVVRIWLFLLAF
jgi:hypothetical protein